MQQLIRFGERDGHDGVEEGIHSVVEREHVVKTIFGDTHALSSHRLVQSWL